MTTLAVAALPAFLNIALACTLHVRTKQLKYYANRCAQCERREQQRGK